MGSIPSELRFAEGLVGLPALRRFVLRAVGDGPLLELVSIEDDHFGFAALPGDAVRAGFAEALRADGVVSGDAAILVLLSVHGDPPGVTANLAGPIVVEEDGSARQLVLEGTGYSLREPVGSPG